MSGHSSPIGGPVPYTVAEAREEEKYRESRTADDVVPPRDRPQSTGGEEENGPQVAKNVQLSVKQSATAATQNRSFSPPFVVMPNRRVELKPLRKGR